LSRTKLPCYYFHAIFAAFAAYLILALVFEGSAVIARGYFLSVLTVLLTSVGIYVGIYTNLSARYRTVIGWTLIAGGACILAYNILKLVNVL